MHSKFDWNIQPIIGNMLQTRLMHNLYLDLEGPALLSVNQPDAFSN